MKFSRQDKLEIIRNIDREGLAYDVEYERVVDDLEDFVSNTKLKLSDSELDSHISDYQVLKNKDGNRVFTRNHSNGNVDIIDDKTYMDEQRFNLLPARIKKLLTIA